MKIIDYNTCDCCNKVEDTTKLYWTEWDLEGKNVDETIYGFDAVCEDCLKTFVQ